MSIINFYKQFDSFIQEIKDNFDKNSPPEKTLEKIRDYLLKHQNEVAEDNLINHKITSSLESISKELNIQTVELIKEVNQLKPSFKNYLGLKNIPSYVIARLDPDILEIAKLASAGNPDAFYLLKQCAENQSAREKIRQQEITKSLTDPTCIDVHIKKGTDPFEGLFDTSKPHYFTHAELNAHLQLSQLYLSQNNLEEALKHHHLAFQSTGFIREFNCPPKLDTEVKKQYKELTRRMSSGALQASNEAIKKMEPEDLKRSLMFLNRALAACDYITVLAAKDLPHLAMHAVKLGQISRQQFATIMRLWAEKEEGGGQLQFLRLFDEQGNPDRRVGDVIKSTMQPTFANESRNGALKANVKPFLDDQGMERMIEFMRTAPPSEQCYFIGPDLEGFRSDLSNGKEGTVSQFINVDAGFNVLSRIKLQKQDMRIIPAHSLEVAFLKARYQEKAVLPNIVVGNSSEKDISQNGLDKTRDMQMPFPGCPVPKTADNRLVLSAKDFLVHDFFHCYSSSEVGPAAPLFIEIADFMQKSFDVNAPDVGLLYNFLIDLDMPEYRHHIQGLSGWIRDLEHDKPEELFWLALSLSAMHFKGKSDAVHAALKKITAYLLEHPELSKKYGIAIDKAALQRTFEHIQKSLTKQKLPNSLSWIKQKHPIFAMIEALKK